MAVTIASDVLTLMRKALLHDPLSAIYQDSDMWPVMDLAYRQLQTKLSAMGISTNKLSFTPITIAIGETEKTNGGGLPANMLYPVHLWERISGSNDRYSDMIEQVWNPDVQQGTYLRYWTWQDEKLIFPGALSAIQVKIQGVQTVGTITAGNSPIIIQNCESWLAQRSASIAALTIGGNPTRAKALDIDLTTIWDDFKATLGKRQQAIPVRRRRTRYRQS